MKITLHVSVAVTDSALKQIKLTQVDTKLSIELINDKEFADQAPMNFVPKKDLL